MSSPLISIIVPCYNVGPYVKRAIQSILSQTYENIEIIAVEQNSTDNTLEELTALSGADNRLKVINCYHIRCAGIARNIGLMASKGMYICFIDSDDFVESDMVALLYQAIHKNNAEIAYCDICMEDYENTSSYTRKIHPDYNHSSEDTILYELFHTHESTNKMYTRRFLLENSIFFPDASYSEDTSFVNRAMAKAKKMVYVQKSLYHYVLNRPGSTTSSFEENAYWQFKEVMQHTVDFYKGIHHANKDIINIALYDACIEQYLRFFFEKRVDNVPPKDFITFMQQNFPDIEQNRMYGFDLKYSLKYRIAKMHDAIREKASEFRENPIVIFSASKGGIKMADFLKSQSITPAYFCDNDPKKHGTIIDGIRVIAPDEIKKSAEHPIIIIAADVKYYESIQKQLLEMGVPSSKIFP